MCSHLLCCQHNNRVCIFSCVMNITDSSGYSLVACPVPFRHISCQEVNSRFTRVWSADASKLQTCYHDLCANFRQFSDCVQCFVSELVVTQAWCGYFVQLICCFVCQFEKSFNAFSCMTLHVVSVLKCLNRACCE